MKELRVERWRNVPFVDPLLWPQLHNQNRLRASGRLVGDSRDTRRSLPVDNFYTPWGPQASAGPRNTCQAYGRRTESSFPVLWPRWKVGQRRETALGLVGNQNCLSLLLLA